MTLIDPKEITIGDQGFIISMIPAYYAIELIPKYFEYEKDHPDDWDVKKSFIISVLKYTQVIDEDTYVTIDNQEIIDLFIESPFVIKILMNQMIEYNCSFLHNRKDLYFLNNYVPSFRSQSFLNINGFIGAILSDNKATLHELKTVYSLSDMYLMWEVIVTSRYNEYKASEEAKAKAKK